MDKDHILFLGNVARKARLNLGLTQEQLAERLGLSVEFYGRIERGNSNPSIETFASIATHLGVSADTLIDIDLMRALMAKAPTGTSAADPPELRKLERKLRKVRPQALRFIRMLLNEIDRRPPAPKPADHEEASSEPAPAKTGGAPKKS